MTFAAFLLTALGLFVLGTVGSFLSRRSFVVMLLCLELMLLGGNLTFLAGAVVLDDLVGLTTALWVMTAAAAETSLGLALCVLHLRLRQTLDVELLALLKG